MLRRATHPNTLTVVPRCWISGTPRQPRLVSSGWSREERRSRTRNTRQERISRQNAAPDLPSASGALPADDSRPHHLLGIRPTALWRLPTCRRHVRGNSLLQHPVAFMRTVNLELLGWLPTGSSPSRCVAPFPRRHMVPTRRVYPTLWCPWIATIYTSIHELMVDGLLASVGVGIVSLIRSSSLVTRVPVPMCTGTDPVAPGVVEWWIPPTWFRRIKCRKLITENVFLWSRHIPCVECQAFVAAQQRTRTWNACWLTGNVRQSHILIRFHFLKFSWIMHWNWFTCSCISCICEAFVLSPDIFSRVVHRIRRLVSSLHFSHLVYTPYLCLSKRFFLPR